MQDAATVHAEALHIGPLDLRIVWVLSRMKARLTRPLLPYERLRCETWCPGIKGASWYRSFSFFVDNKPVGDAQSMWVTLDPETHRIVRPSAFPEAEQYLHTSRGELFAPLPKLSCDNVRLHHVHEVRYSDLDVNNHVNNVRAVELISDALDRVPACLLLRSTCTSSRVLSPSCRSTTPPKPPAANRFRC